MSKRNKNAIPEYEIPDEPTEPVVGEGAAESEADRAQRVEEIQAMAASGALEAPAGAEEIVEALVQALASRDELLGRLQRALADHQNYQRRAAMNEQEARTQARTGILQAVIPVLDHFELALKLDPATTGAEQVMGGVRVIRDELMRVLGQFGVAVIDPRPGDEFDPNQHEALLRQPAEGVAPGCVAANFGVGYRLGERVVRPAKVAVAPSETS